MTYSRLLKIAGLLALITAVIHLIGTFMPIPAEQTQVQDAIAVMNATLVPMPLGSAKSYMQILNGNNFGTALLLLICALQLFVAARSDSSQISKRTISIAGVGLAGFALISLTYFFPIPAILTGLAALLCFVAATVGTGKYGGDSISTYPDSTDVLRG